MCIALYFACYFYNHGLSMTNSYLKPQPQKGGEEGNWQQSSLDFRHDWESLLGGLVTPTERCINGL